MPSPQEKLANALGALKKLQKNNDIIIIHSSDLTTQHKQILKRNGFIKEVIKGWYISTRPDEKDGDTSSWYMSFWHFIAKYMNYKFNKNWCLSPEQSLMLHSGNTTIPKQLLVRSPKASNNVINLLFGTSILDNKLEIIKKSARIAYQGLQLYSLEEGLIAASPDFYKQHPTDARTCLSLLTDGAVLLGKLLDGGQSVVAARLAGALRNIGNEKLADNIVNTMKAAGYDVRETDPFIDKVHLNFQTREVSPYAFRIKLMWKEMRMVVLNHFPETKSLPQNINDYLKTVEDYYAEDAYHSLSIEGYHVTENLIEKVRDGNWNPDLNDSDFQTKNAMAARGYYQAFQAVKRSIEKILKGNNSGEVVDKDHVDWYRELFVPSVTAGLIKASDLAGYRNNQVYIKGSMHTPFNPKAVRDAMPVLFDLLKQEQEPAVRAVLGHFVFVYIHPYMDGNGRIARFLFNAMLASGGYPWTVIPLNKRDEYMKALEEASVEGDISKFTQFLGELVENAS